MPDTTTDHPGEGWVEAGDIGYIRTFSPHVLGVITDAKWGDAWGGFVEVAREPGNRDCYIRRIKKAPTAALAAQRVAALADEVREDVRRLAEAWGVAGLPNPSETPNSSPPAVTVDREAAVEVVADKLGSIACSALNSVEARDVYADIIRADATALLDDILACITPAPTAKEVSNA